MAKRSQRFIDEAASDALLRFGPELSVLKSLMSEATSSYRQKVHSAQAGAAGIQAAVAQARPQLEAIYPDAVGGIPGLSRAQALNDLVSRGVRASESAAGSRRTALQELAADRAKIGTRRTDIAQELGAFTTSQVGKLSAAAAQRDLSNRISLRSQSQSERNSVRSSGIDPDTGKPIPGGKLDPKAKKPPSAAKRFKTKYGAELLSREQHNAQRSKVDSAVSVIRDQMAAGNKNRGQLAKLLTLGRSSKTVILNGQKVPLPTIEKTDPFVASMALDVAFNGRLSGKNAAEAHRRGFSVTGLGLPATTAAQRKKAQEDRKRRQQATSRRTNALANAFGPFGT